MTVLNAIFHLFHRWVAVWCILLAASGPAAADDAQLWQALGSGGHFALLRHALAPGTGDPPDFAVDRCETQRNLSDEGRRQAERIGGRFRANGIPAAQVYSSQWCRCLETARLLNIGPVRELPILNSFFRRYERRESQTRRLKEWLAARDFARPLVLVTHQVNITALTGVFPRSGELVVVHRDKGGKLVVAGTIETE